LKAEGRRQKAEGTGQKSEGRRQREEVRRQKADFILPSNLFLLYFLRAVFHSVKPC